MRQFSATRRPSPPLELRVVHLPQGASYPIILGEPRTKRGWPEFLSRAGGRLAALGEELPEQLARLFGQHSSKYFGAMVQGLMAK